jgi:hypothetical protein
MMMMMRRRRRRRRKRYNNTDMWATAGQDRPEMKLSPVNESYRQTVSDTQ